MKRFLIFGGVSLVVLTLGCDPSSETKTVNDKEFAIVNDGSTSGATVQIVSLQGHRFAVAVCGSHVSICEVTSNSAYPFAKQ